MVSATSQPSVSFTLTAEDYANALRLHMRRYWFGNIRIKLFVAAVIAACVLVIAVSGLDSVAGSLAIGVMIGLVGLTGWLVLAYFVFLPRRARKIYGQQKTMQYSVEASWSSDAYSAATATAASTVPWLDYHGWSADETMILLMQSPVLFQMVPRDALSLEQVNDLLDHLSRSGLRRI